MPSEEKLTKLLNVCRRVYNLLKLLILCLAVCSRLLSLKKNGYDDVNLVWSVQYKHLLSADFKQKE